MIQAPIPERYDRKRVKQLFRIVTGSTPKSDDPRYWGDAVPWVTPEDLGGLGENELALTLRSISHEGLVSCATTLSPAGSLVLSTRAPIGYVASLAMDFAINQGCRALVPRTGVCAPFYRYVLSTRRSQLQALGRGSTFQELSTGDLGNVVVPTPPYEEQRAIVRFLDEETARVDALIEKNAKSDALAVEARDTRAAALFLQQDLKPMRRVIAEICDGPFGSNLKSDHYATQGARVIRLQNIGAGAFLDMDKAYVALEHFDRFRRHEAKEGDLLVAGLGDENNRLGRACLVPRDLGTAMVKADCFRVRLDPSRALHSYVMHYLNSPGAEPDMIWHSRGATRLRMNGQGIAAIRIPLPSLPEQEQIVRELSELDQNVRSVRLKLRESIQVLKEYRAALITAAVIGQIDVSRAA